MKTLKNILMEGMTEQEGWQNYVYGIIQEMMLLELLLGTKFIYMNITLLHYSIGKIDSLQK